MYGYPTPAELMAAAKDLNTELYVEAGRRAEFLRLMAEQGFVEGFEAQVFRADGSVMWVSEYARTVTAPDGSPLYFEGSVVDITLRKETDRALRLSEAKFRHLVETTSVVPFEAELQNDQMIYVGPQAVQFLGYPLEDWLKPGFHGQHIHPEDQIWVSIVRTKALEEHQNFECEYRMLDTFGKIVWTREIVSVLPGESGPPLLGGFFLNVTHRRQAEESLQETRHFIEQIANASPTILYLFSPDPPRSHYLSGRIGDILGFTAEALMEMGPFFLLSLAHPDELAEHEAHFTKLVAGEITDLVEREFRLRSASGDWVWVHSRECVFQVTDEGRILKVVGTLEDVTEHRQALDELKTNEALFRELAETTRVIPFDFDIEAGRFSYVGPQAEALTGHSLALWFSAEQWRTIIHPEDLDNGARFSREAALLGQDFEAEFRLVGAEQQIIWVRQIVHVDGHDDHSHLRGFLLDITESKSAEEERERARLQLRELAAHNQVIREEERVYIAREIHDELGQALTALKLDLAWMSGRLAKSSEELLIEPLQDKVHGMEQMITRTLQTTRRILSALRPPLLDELGLRAAIEWHAEDFAKRLGVRFTLNIGPIGTIPEAAGIAIFRAFQEMLTNVARHARASRVKVTLQQSTSELLLQVEDNGRGIPPGRLSGAQSFGLLGMRERAWMVGGQLEILSTEGQGTTVKLIVPMSVDEHAEPPEGGPAQILSTSTT
jgi:PAS domain S-box-containing protein